MVRQICWIFFCADCFKDASRHAALSKNVPLLEADKRNGVWDVNFF